VLLFAKGVASGLPLGGIVAERATFARWPAGTHGSTFGGNPVACAAALATLDVLESAELCTRAGELGRELLGRLREAGRDNPAVVEVRGVGLMIGVELVNGDVASRVQRECFRNGLLVLTCGTRDQVVRLVPPLTVSDDEVAHGLGTFLAALEKVAS
jgi:4-aminobutyrate aminotransferase